MSFTLCRFFRPASLFRPCGLLRFCRFYSLCRFCSLRCLFSQALGDVASSLSEDTLQVLTEDDFLLEQLLGKLCETGNICRDDLLSLVVRYFHDLFCLAVNKFGSLFAVRL